MSRPASPALSAAPEPIDREVLERTERIGSLEDQIKELQKRLTTLKQDVFTAKFESDVKTAYRKARIHCDNPRHFYTRAFPCKVAKGVRHSCADCKDFVSEASRPPAFILKEMVPYKKASCQCERDALVWGCTRNTPGTTTDKWVAAGADCVGLGESKDRPRRVLETRFTLNKEELALLKRRYPSWYIHTTATTGHDHPVAHVDTMLSSRSLFEEKLPRGTTAAPTIVLDINGSPRSNKSQAGRLGMKILTTCKVMTPKDELRRVTKWGPQTEADGQINWHDLYDREIGAEGASIGPADYEAVRHLTFIHTGYYYSKADLLKLMKRGNKDLVAHMIMHRFNGAAGNINGGEQIWVKSKRDRETIITQTNKKTGETYSHPDNSWLFESTSWRATADDTDGLAWTINQFSEDTFYITMKVVSNFPVAGPGIPNARDLYASGGFKHRPDPNSSEWVQEFGTVLVKTGATFKELVVRPSLFPLFNEARRRMDKRPRTAPEYKSHAELLETKIRRFEQTEAGHIVRAEDAIDIKRASFWCDVDLYEYDQELFDEHWLASRRAQRTYEFGHHGAQRHLATVAIDGALNTGAVGKSGTAVLGMARALLTSSAK